MERLIANKLIYGGLVEVARPHLVERYNAALAGLGLPATKLESFSIDATGYSPEVAAERTNEQYLDPHGVNRRFIIISPEQARAPVVNINFSTTIDFMRSFFADNAEAIKTLTLKDAIYGDIENSTYRVDDIADILSIKHVEFQVNTANRLLDKARRLQKLLDRFHEEENGWRDTDLLNDILSLARACGDIRVNAIIPRQTRFELGSFWTRHFGGLYVFRGEDGVTVIGHDNNPGFSRDDRLLDRYISLSQPRHVYDFLARSGRLEPPNFDWLEFSGQLDRRIEFIVRHAIARITPDADILGASNVWIKNWIYQNYDELSRDGTFPFLQSLRKQAFNRRQPRISSKAAHQLLVVARAPVDHPEKLLINRLLSEFTPFDFLTRFMVNKEGFYNQYENWPDPYRDYVVHTINNTFVADKDRFWSSLFDEA